jgi:hypothetical protein
MKIVITGTTAEGRTFRPSDWAERMCGALSNFRNRRINYDPRLLPVSLNGVKCLIMDPSLREDHVSLYRSILDFAETNHLVVEHRQVVDKNNASEAEPKELAVVECKTDEKSGQVICATTTASDLLVVPNIDSENESELTATDEIIPNSDVE